MLSGSESQAIDRTPVPCTLEPLTPTRLFPGPSHWSVPLKNRSIVSVSRLQELGHYDQPRGLGIGPRAWDLGTGMMGEWLGVVSRQALRPQGTTSPNYPPGYTPGTPDGHIRWVWGIGWGSCQHTIPTHLGIACRLEAPAGLRDGMGWRGVWGEYTPSPYYPTQPPTDRPLVPTGRPLGRLVRHQWEGSVGRCDPPSAH